MRAPSKFCQFAKGALSERKANPPGSKSGDPSGFARNGRCLGLGQYDEGLVFGDWLSTKWDDLVSLSASRIYP